MSDTPTYWFPRKRYGWGWGPPTTWQGWVVIVAYLVLLMAAIVFVPPGRHMGAFFMTLAVLTVALLVICKAKGEPPRWQWGDD